MRLEINMKKKNEKSDNNQNGDNDKKLKYVVKNKNQKFGYVVLVVGLILLLVSFFLSIIFLLNPEEWIKPFSELVDTGGGGIDNLVEVLLYFFPLVLLLVMGTIGGRIAKYGIQLIRSPDKRIDGIIEEGAK